MKKLGSLIILIMCLLAGGCSSQKILAFYCQESQIEIYADGKYLGRDLVRYTVPKGRDYVEVSCRNGGVEVYSRRYYVKGGNNSLIEIQIPRNYKYSEKPY